MLGARGTGLWELKQRTEKQECLAIKFLKYFLFSSQNVSHHTLEKNSGRKIFSKTSVVCVYNIACARIFIKFVFVADRFCLSH